MRYLAVTLFALLFATAGWAQSNYKLSVGDTVAVEVLEDPNLNRSLLVLPDGSVNFPFAGRVAAAGLSVSQLQSAITQGIASNFANEPNVFVSVASVPESVGSSSHSHIDVYILGEVNAPGPKLLHPGTTFLQALSESGGFTKFAATKRLQVRRTSKSGKQTMYKINYRALADGAELQNDIVLRDGDVILVPERRLFE